MDEARAPKPPKHPSLDYFDLVREFRRHLGDGLAVPPNPTPGWISRVVGSAKEIGLNAEHIEKICESVVERYHNPPYDLAWLVRGATRFLAAVASGGSVKDGRPA